MNKRLDEKTEQIEFEFMKEIRSAEEYWNRSRRDFIPFSGLVRCLKPSGEGVTEGYRFLLAQYHLYVSFGGAGALGALAGRYLNP